MNAHRSGAPRRGVTDAHPVDTDIEDISTAPARGRRAARRFGKGAVAGVIAGVLAAGSLFAYAFAARDGHQPAVDSFNADAAVPVAAQEAAKLGFADRSADVSRNAIREGISDVKADANADARTKSLGIVAKDAIKSELDLSDKERIELMDKDLKLVEKQAAKLKKEAEEAARRLEEARKLRAAADQGSGEASDDQGDYVMAPQDISNLSSSGGSMPVKSNYRIGAHFGQRGLWARYHTGQDFPAPVGTPVYAVAAGVVLSPTHAGWAGTNVVIQHGPGATLYAHLSRRVVSPGQTVKPGQLIGYVGTTGRSFGPHLHFEYYKNGTTPGSVYQASNPMAFLRSLGVR